MEQKSLYEATKSMRSNSYEHNVNSEIYEVSLNVNLELETYCSSTTNYKTSRFHFYLVISLYITPAQTITMQRKRLTIRSQDRT